MKKLLFFVLAFSIHFAADAADSFSTLEERMSGKEFEEAGLEKLTGEELAVLNDWLRRHSVAKLESTAARPTASVTNADSIEDTRGFEKQPKGDPKGKVINGTIDGVFDGWSGKDTLFKLTNGMIWQQDEKDTFSVEPIKNAEITIKKRRLGNWHLSVVGHDSKVQVKRIQ
jgi:hypothetical protein